MRLHVDHVNFDMVMLTIKDETDATIVDLYVYKKDGTDGRASGDLYEVQTNVTRDKDRRGYSQTARVPPPTGIAVQS